MRTFPPLPIDAACRVWSEQAQDERRWESNAARAWPARLAALEVEGQPVPWFDAPQYNAWTQYGTVALAMVELFALAPALRAELNVRQRSENVLRVLRALL